MPGDAYTLEYTEIFNKELAEAVRYIAYELRNPDAAARLVSRTEDAIRERLFAPESFEPVPTKQDREHPYYRPYRSYRFNRPYRPKWRRGEGAECETLCNGMWHF